MSIFSSSGIKRTIVAWLNTILGVLYSIPLLPVEVQTAIQVLSQVVEALGGVAVTQAAAAGTFSKHLLLSLSSTVGAILLIATWVPALAPVAAILIKIQPILAALAAGSTLKSTLNGK